ncbi:MAG: PilZ domain-containing protein [Planctomycetes bacterium]|nr:PilZ domain-containing protein [Planctomycetota bacterium]
MAHEKRLYTRAGVHWRGHATLSDGPHYAICVLDVSAGGAKLVVPEHAKPSRNELLELCAYRRNLGPFGLYKPVTAFGRIVRISPHADEHQVEVAIRFHTPLRKRVQQEHGPRLARWLSLVPEVSPCA